MPSETSNEIDALCYNIRDLIVLQLEGINRLENDHFISNLTDGEKAELKELKNNKDIVIKLSDKNLGLTIMDLQWYLYECFRELQDEKVYQEFSELEISALLNKIKFTLREIIKQHDEALSFQEKRFLLQNVESFTIPLFYIIPKLKKNPIVGRPISGCCDWITKPASRLVAFHLQIYYNLFDNILKDRMEVVQIVESNELDQQIHLSTIDIVGLYTNIPLDHFMESIKRLILVDHPIPLGELILDLLHFILYNNVLQFNGSYFIQIFGLLWALLLHRLVPTSIWLF